jgi:hypothetical protein
MQGTAREHFTVDLRGLRTALSARAACDGTTESDVLRSALATALGTSEAVPLNPADRITTESASVSKVKLSVRLSRLVARRLNRDARAAGFSRGAYLTRLIRGAPAVASSADRAAPRKALTRSSEELAVISRETNHLTRLLRLGKVEEAKFHKARLTTLDRDVRAHLALAAAVLTDLSAMREGKANRNARSRE